MVRRNIQSRGRSSSAWRERQNRDPFVKAARQSGFRARAVYKLQQIDRKYRLIKPNSIIVDLGAAPGSWSQYAALRIGAHGRIVAVDRLAMRATPKVHFVHGDFTDARTVEQIICALQKRSVDLVLSDIAPNLSGIASVDHGRVETLQQNVLAFCRRSLKTGGVLLSKLFAGESEALIRKQFRACFATVQGIKPDASRAKSREFYLLAQGYLGEVSGQ